MSLSFTTDPVENFFPHMLLLFVNDISQSDSPSHLVCPQDRLQRKTWEDKVFARGSCRVPFPQLT